MICAVLGHKTGLFVESEHVALEHLMDGSDVRFKASTLNTNAKGMRMKFFMNNPEVGFTSEHNKDLRKWK